MNDLDLDALDRWITSPRYSESTDIGYCHNKACKLYGETIEVRTYSEYGRTYWVNDGECPGCGHQLEEEPASDEQEESEGNDA